ncbi:MAG: DUF5803 family protein [Methanospirillum sp.]|nr:DUF5803 family protein [Methanospirillum sp.]
MRSYTRIIACCIAALILLVFPVAGGNVSVDLHEDGKAYTATVVLNQTERYDLVEPGMLGERIPLDVVNLSVRNETDPVSVTPDRGVLDLPLGNYTLQYEGRVTGNTLQMLFSSPENVSVHLPYPFMIGNPLLTSLQPSGSTTTAGNNTTRIDWSNVRSVELRYYEENQERLLYIFAQFWLIIAVVLLLPFLLSREKKIDREYIPGKQKKK